MKQKFNVTGMTCSACSAHVDKTFTVGFDNGTKYNEISYAQEQLKHPDITAGDVAILLGYEDYRSFSRAFKTRTGLTPSDYQKQYTGEGRR